jgi:hypothetical protein
VVDWEPAALERVGIEIIDEESELEQINSAP